MSIDKAVMDYLGKFDPAFYVKASKSDVKDILKNTLENCYPGEYGDCGAYPVSRELLISLLGKEEMTKEDIINLGLSTHGRSLGEFRKGARYLKILKEFDKIASGIEFSKIEFYEQSTGFEKCGVVTRNVPETHDKGFGIVIKDRLEDWGLVLSYTDTANKKLKPRIMISLDNEIKKQKENGILEILKRKEIDKLAERFSLGFKLRSRSAYRTRDEYFEVSKTDGTAYERVLAKLDEKYREYKPEELVKSLLDFEIEGSEKPIGLELNVSKGRGVYSEGGHTYIKEDEINRKVKIKSHDCSKKGWKNLKSLTEEALRAIK